MTTPSISSPNPKPFAKISKISMLASVALVAFTLLAGVGCAREKTTLVTADDLRSDISPSLHSLVLNKDQRKTLRTRVIDTNLRMIYEDLDMVFLLDRPTRLSKHPVP